MDAGIAKFLPHLDEQLLDLVDRPAQPVLLLGPRKHSEAEPGHPGHKVLVVPHADLLVTRVFRPAVRRPLVLVLHDVDEARRFKLLLILEHRVERALELAHALAEDVDPMHELRVGGDGVVVAVEDPGRVLHFDDAAGAEGSGACLISCDQMDVE